MHAIYVGGQAIWFLSPFPFCYDIQARSTGMCFSRTPEEVFNAALVEYVKQTGNDLSKHPLSTKLENCKLPSDVLDVIGELAKTFHPKEGNKSLVKALEPTVNVVCSLSGAFGNSIGVVRPSEMASSCLI
jgi:hypothetical protein